MEREVYLHFSSLRHWEKSVSLIVTEKSRGIFWGKAMRKRISGIYFRYVEFEVHSAMFQAYFYMFTPCFNST